LLVNPELWALVRDGKVRAVISTARTLSFLRGLTSGFLSRRVTRHAEVSPTPPLQGGLYANSDAASEAEVGQLGMSQYPYNCVLNRHAQAPGKHCRSVQKRVLLTLPDKEMDGFLYMKSRV